MDSSGVIFLLVFLLAGNPGCLKNEILSLDEVTGGWPAARHRAPSAALPVPLYELVASSRTLLSRVFLHTTRRGLDLLFCSVFSLRYALRRPVTS